jgi:hypothetical protein
MKDILERLQLVGSYGEGLRSYWYLISGGEVNHVIPKDSHRATPLEDICLVLEEDVFDELLLESISTRKGNALTRA